MPSHHKLDKTQWCSLLSPRIRKRSFLKMSCHWWKQKEIHSIEIFLSPGCNDLAIKDNLLVTLFIKQSSLSLLKQLQLCIITKQWLQFRLLKLFQSESPWRGRKAFRCLNKTRVQNKDVFPIPLEDKKSLSLWQTLLIPPSVKLELTLLILFQNHNYNWYDTLSCQHLFVHAMHLLHQVCQLSPEKGDF